MPWSQTHSARNVDCTADGRLSLLRHVLPVVLASIAMTACSEQSPATPAAPTGSVAAVCNYFVFPTSVSTSVSGGSFRIFVDTIVGSTCQWTVSSSEGWIRPVGTASGRGAGEFVMAADPTSTSGRHGTVTLSFNSGTQSIDVDQIVCTGIPAVTNISPEPQTISASSPCSLHPVSFDMPWLVLRNINGAETQVQVDVAVNTGPARVGHVTTGIGTLIVMQAAGNCVTAITPSSQSFSENGGSGAFTVTAVPGCAWHATTSVPTAFTRIEGADGSGNGVVTFTLKSNSVPFEVTRSFVVGGSMQFLITQSKCPVTVLPTDLHVPAAGGNFSITVTSLSCEWVASIPTFRGSGTFFSIVGPASGTGSGTVQLSVVPNQTGRVRSDSLTVAEQTVHVTQDP
jgi:hypothetical protein